MSRSIVIFFTFLLVVIAVTGTPNVADDDNIDFTPIVDLLLNYNNHLDALQDLTNLLEFGVIMTNFCISPNPETDTYLLLLDLYHRNARLDLNTKESWLLGLTAVQECRKEKANF